MRPPEPYDQVRKQGSIHGFRSVNMVLGVIEMVVVLQSGLGVWGTKKALIA